MTTYYHYYRCGCVHWERNQWVIEKSDEEFPKYHSVPHYSFDNAARCNRYLRFAHTEKALSHKKLAIEDLGYGVQLLMRSAKSKSGPTIAAMWEPEGGRWLEGSCKHELAKVGGPPGFVARVTALGCRPDDWAFGWNCAEVECVIKAYRGSNPRRALDLKGCFFIAYSVATPPGLYGACRTCRDWITALGGKFHSPHR